MSRKARSNSVTDLDTAGNGGSGSDLGSGSEGSGSGSETSGSGSGPVGADSGEPFGTDSDIGGGFDGGNERGSDGIGEGTRRKRGRPKRGETVELAREVSGRQVGKPRGRKTGPDLGTLIDSTVVGLFGLVAVATAHEHWLKEKVDVVPITDPLKAWVDQLPAKTLKRLEEKLAPTLLVVGLATIAGPDLVAEMRIRGDERKRVKGVVSQPQGTPGSEFQPNTFAARPTDQHPVGNGSRSSAGGWVASIPSAPIVGSEYDV